MYTFFDWPTHAHSYNLEPLLKAKICQVLRYIDKGGYTIVLIVQIQILKTSTSV